MSRFKDYFGAISLKPFPFSEVILIVSLNKQDVKGLWEEIFGMEVYEMMCLLGKETKDTWFNKDSSQSLSIFHIWNVYPSSMFGSQAI